MRKRLIKLTSACIILLVIFSVAAGAFTASSRPVLRKGMSSSAVKTLQSNLKKLGFFSVAPTGYYGDYTVSAVKKFQKKYKIPSTGVVATLTYSKLDALLKPAAPKKTGAIKRPKPEGLKMGSSGKDVMKLQKDLTELGYIKVYPTGNYGSITEGAVLQFQKYYGIGQSGIADKKTLSVIERLLEQAAGVSRGDAVREGEDSEGAEQQDNGQITVAPLFTVQKDWVAALPKTPFLKGVGQYEGVVFHYTAVPGDSARIEANAEKKNWQRAFAHEYIDAEEVIQVADPDYKAWGAGGRANDRFIHLELCDESTLEDFNASFKKMTRRTAEYLYSRQLGVSPARADGSGTLWSHYQISKYLGGTNHSDPIEYLAKWGLTWNDVIDAVTEEYNAIAAEQAGADSADVKADTTAADAGADAKDDTTASLPVTEETGITSPTP